MPFDICFISPNGCGAISPGQNIGRAGGVEIQVGFLASELARRGHRVGLIAFDYGQADGRLASGVTVYNMCDPRAGLLLLRFFHPRWTSLRKAMARAGAGVYIQTSAEPLTGQACHWCRRHGRRFVFVSASNADCAEPLINLHTWRERALYRYGLRRADAVIVQTSDQQNMLAEHFRRRSVIIPSCSPDGEYQPRGFPDGRRARRLLWVGRISPEKRLELLLELAELLPEYHFDVVGDANAETVYSRAVKARARVAANVTLHGRVSRPEVDPFYLNAAALICTSAWEGFPNTFLEAWRHGLPVVSTFDPDRLIAREKLGGVGADAAALKREIQRLLGNPEAWLGCSGRARQYFAENLTCEAAADAYERLLERLLAADRAKAAPAVVDPAGRQEQA